MQTINIIYKFDGKVCNSLTCDDGYDDLATVDVILFSHSLVFKYATSFEICNRITFVENRPMFVEVLVQIADRHFIHC